VFHKIRDLSKNMAVYGLGDVAISVVNFLLLPLYVRYLSPGDYGVLGLLGSVEVIAKIFFRWGLDGAFMRLYYDAPDEAGRRRLASTIFLFLLATNGVLLAGSLFLSPPLARGLFETESNVGALRLVLLNMFITGFTFIPFHVLRMEQRSLEFSALTFGRSVATVILRIVLIVGFGYGVLGVVAADIIVTVGVVLVLLRHFAPLIRAELSRPLLREALAFGLPRIPHAAAQQVMAVGDKFLLAFFNVPLAQVGVYTMGVSFGLTQKLFLSAFEYAWAPFYYANAREPGAPRLFASVTTYGVAALALMTAGLTAIGGDIVVAMAGPAYRDAAPVVTWTAVGVLLQGVYLLTSIGLNITKQTAYYPVATSAAAAVNVVLNLALIPRFGIVGAAWANAACYAVQAAIAFGFSNRFYPVTYETGRLARVLLAAAVACLAARSLPATLPPVAGVFARGTTVVAVMALGLWLGGFFRPEELRVLRRVRRRPADREPVLAPTDTVELAGEIVAAEPPHETSAAVAERVEDVR
jgi:O-antigen/teichoic acid export membrane protein